MKATLTLKKPDLVAALEARRAEINDHFDEQAGKFTEELDRRKSEKGRVAHLADWHRAVAEGLADGSITLTPSGSLKGAPVKPGTKGRGYAYRFEDYSDEMLIEQRNQVERGREARLKELDTSINLINMSVGDVVEVNAADYQGLLSGHLQQYWH